MAIENQVEPIGRPALMWGRRAGVRFVVGVAALVLGVFVVLGSLPILYALGGFVVIAVAAVLTGRRFVGFDAEAQYIALAEQRVATARASLAE